GTRRLASEVSSRVTAAVTRVRGWEFRRASRRSNLYQLPVRTHSWPRQTAKRPAGACTRARGSVATIDRVWWHRELQRHDGWLLLLLGCGLDARGAAARLRWRRVLVNRTTHWSGRERRPAEHRHVAGAWDRACGPCTVDRLGLGRSRPSGRARPRARGPRRDRAVWGGARRRRGRVSIRVAV